MFPFCGGGVSSKSKEVENESNTPADFLLSCIAKATCHTYQDHIIRIPSLSINSTKQLYTDIGNLIFYFLYGYIFKFLSNPYMAWANFSQASTKNRTWSELSHWLIAPEGLPENLG